MNDTALVLAASLTYLVATVIYGTYLLRFNPRFARMGRAVLALGVLLNLLALAVRGTAGQLGLEAYDLFLSLSALTGVGYIFWEWKSHSPLLGAFLTPVLTMVTYSLHVFRYESGVARSAELEIITPVHIAASVLSFLILAISALAAATEVVQEYRLKTKRVKLAMGRQLPSLRRLERISHRALLIGFPIYSIAMALGAVWFVQGDESNVTRHFIMAAFSWLLYAVTIHARVVIGLKGRKAAMLTLAAFLSALFVALLSILRTGD